MSSANTPKPGASDIAQLIARDISSGDPGAGDRLPPERQLADNFGVARGTIRAAMRLLAERGLVAIRAGSGTYVVEQSEHSAPAALENANPLELMDARFALEPHTCRLAVLHGRRTDFDHLDDLCVRMEASLEDPARFSAADTEFHRALAQCTRNGLLVWIIDQITEVRNQDEWAKMRHLTLNSEMISCYNRQHRKVLGALRARDAETAAGLMKAHLETARLSLTRAAAT